MHLPEQWLQDLFTGWELGSPVPPVFPSLETRSTKKSRRHSLFTGRPQQVNESFNSSGDEDKNDAGFPSIHTDLLWQKYGPNTDPISIKIQTRKL